MQELHATRRLRLRARVLILPLLLLAASPMLASCGGAGGGPGPSGSGQGLVLLNFAQAGTDNVSLNTVLQLVFSEPVNPASVHNASLQVREGGQFGVTVDGKFSVIGATVFFEPTLPSLCDLSDSGFKADTEYAVLCVGWPESFSIKNTQGQPLDATSSWDFHTRANDDPQKYIDALPGQSPFVIDSSPGDSNEAVYVGSAAVPQRIDLLMSENVDPCSVTETSIVVEIHEKGGTWAQSIDAPNGRKSGFVTAGTDTDDKDLGDPTTWGPATTATPWPGGVQTLPKTVSLVQDFSETRIVISPIFGQDPSAPELGGILPENVLLVVRLTFEVTDFGGQPLTPYSISFTTENLNGSPSSYLIENEGETPYDDSLTLAKIHPEVQSRVQAFLLFAGDGDNGALEQFPSLPQAGPACLFDLQTNDNSPDEFDPTASMVLDTGPLLAVCPNESDGSTAVVWEFKTFRIRSGIIVRIIGANPAIILVQGDVTIETGGILQTRADGSGGAPQGRGANGYNWISAATAIAAGGTGMAGAGNGGDSAKYNDASITHGGDGFTAFGSSDGVGVEGGEGAGLGGVIHDTIYPGSNGTSQGGGGGGHGALGGTSSNNMGNGHTNQGPVRGNGGAPYPTTPGAEAMPQPSAGAGGGAGGNEEWGGNYKGNYSTGGGSGGAGGGFVDITSSGDIFIFGMIDARGSNGGNGGTTNYYAGPGGGGGGAGGGIRLLTPNDIVLSPTAVLTTAGGLGGNSPLGNSGGGGPQNHGAPGGTGRIALEDGNSVIDGLLTATVVPTENQDGFYRGIFDPTRFSGGGLSPYAVTEPFAVGPFNPTYSEPLVTDFIVGNPALTSPGAGKVVIMVEAQSYAMQLDGKPAPVGNGWRTICYFTDNGDPTNPAFFTGHPGSVPRPTDNVGNGAIDNMASLNGDEFLQFRFTMFLNSNVGPTDPGAFVDDMLIRFSYDN